MTIREAIVKSQPLTVWERGYQENIPGSSQLRANIRNLSAGVFMVTVRRARKSLANNKTQLFSVMLANIQKALAPVKKSATNLEKLPEQYKNLAGLFKKELTDKLPPHRPGCDHEIKLEGDKDAPWGPLYYMGCQGMNC